MKNCDFDNLWDTYRMTSYISFVQKTCVSHIATTDIVSITDVVLYTSIWFRFVLKRVHNRSRMIKIAIS